MAGGLVGAASAVINGLASISKMERGSKQFSAMPNGFPKVVTPAKAGVQWCRRGNWIPAFAGMTRIES